MKKAIVTATAEVRAQFNDIDPMNVVWHGNYPRFLEVARVALLERLDYGYAAMVESGYGWPVVDLNIRYIQPVKLLDVMVVTAGLTEWENRMKIEFEIRSKDTGKRLSRAHAVHVAVDLSNNDLLWETPDVFRRKVEPFLS